METNVKKLFANKKQLIFKLKKEKYKVNMENFRRENSEFFQDAWNRIEKADHKEQAAEEFGEEFVRAVDREFHPEKSSFFGDSLLDYNLHMVYYVLPAFGLEFGRDGKMIAEAVCEAWKKRFPKGQIGVSDYEKIYNSFREKIFGIF